MMVSSGRNKRGESSDGERWLKLPGNIVGSVMCQHSDMHYTALRDKTLNVGAASRGVKARQTQLVQPRTKIASNRP
jgi:hypothetical protein